MNGENGDPRDHSNASFVNAVLTNFSLNYANLTNADFRNAEMNKNTTFHYSDLTTADFSTGNDLSGLQDAEQIKGARIVGAKLLGTGITQQEIDDWNVLNAANPADLIGGIPSSINP